jgi:hypothetical protein
MTTSVRTPTPTTPCITDGEPLAWTRRCTTYAIEEHGSSDLPLVEVQDIVQTSFETWMNVTCASGQIDLRAELLEDPSRCDVAEFNSDAGNVNTIVFLSGGEWDDRLYDPSAYAYTTVWHNTRSGAIYDVDMEINEGRGPYGRCPAGGCTDGTVDLQNVVTHEAGHYFGIAHTPDSDLATMYAIAPPGEIDKRTLEPDDIAAICTIYPPGTLPSECDFDPRGGLSLVCGGEDEGCGCTTPGANRPLKWTIPALVVLAATPLAFLRRRRVSSARR